MNEKVTDKAKEKLIEILKTNYTWTNRSEEDIITEIFISSGKLTEGIQTENTESIAQNAKDIIANIARYMQKNKIDLENLTSNILLLEEYNSYDARPNAMMLPYGISNLVMATNETDVSIIRYRKMIEHIFLCTIYASHKAGVDIEAL